MSRALIFDCDGVLADTERDGHLVAFNQMWREQGVNWQWNLGQYADQAQDRRRQGADCEPRAR